MSSSNRSPFAARAPDYEQRVRDGFVGQAFMDLLGARLERVEPGLVEISVHRRDNLLQQHGFFHGGVVATLADNAGGFAAFSLMSRNEQPLSVEFKVNLLAPGVGESLFARGQVVRDGRVLKVCRSDVYALTDGTQKHCATALVTVIARDTLD